MPTAIQFYRGMTTIGGTVIEIKTEQASIIFDFGSVFSGDVPVLDGLIQVREGAYIRDLVNLQAIPALHGYYAKAEFKEPTPLITAEEDTRERAVFISHLHLDHMAYMGCIAPTIPVYMSTPSYKLYQALQQVGEGVEPAREYFGVPFNDTIEVGDITVQFVEVDHDIPGAAALMISTPDGSIIYSGDLRYHGTHPEKVDDFIEAAKALNPNILIMEGTMLSFDEEEDEIIPSKLLTAETVTESALPDVIAAQLLQTEGLAIFNIYHRNIDRIIGCIKAAENAGRIAVLEPETAYLVQQFYPKQAFVTVRLPDSDKLSLNEHTIFVAQGDINANPKRYFLQNSYHHLLQLFDLNLESAVYIHSNGSPLGDYDPSYHNLLKFLRKIDVPMVLIGTGGHAHKEHLKYIVDEINPDVLIPLHSFKPWRLLPKDGVQILPEYGETIYLRAGVVKR